MEHIAPVCALKVDMTNMYANCDFSHTQVFYVQKRNADLLMGFQEKTYV